MNDLKNEVLEIKHQFEETEKEGKSFAMELLEDSKKQNKRLFIIWLVTFIFLILLSTYTIWLLNDITSETEIIEIDDVNTLDNSNIKIGDDLWEE